MSHELRAESSFIDSDIKIINKLVPNRSLKNVALGKNLE